MKKRDLERILKAMGWRFLREGGNHEIWTNGVDLEAVPRHSEINQNTAKGIIKRAQRRPPPVKGDVL